jgi:uncharacterized membrane-anchored protein
MIESRILITMGLFLLIFCFSKDYLSIIPASDNDKVMYTMLLIFGFIFLLFGIILRFIVKRYPNISRPESE